MTKQNIISVKTGERIFRKHFSAGSNDRKGNKKEKKSVICLIMKALSPLFSLFVSLLLNNPLLIKPCKSGLKVSNLRSLFKTEH